MHKESEGEQVDRIDQNSGLKSNAVYYFFFSDSGDLWLGLENGLARAPYPTAYCFWDSENGLKGYVMEVISHKGVMYVATLQGLYYWEHPTYRIIFGDCRIFMLPIFMTFCHNLIVQTKALIHLGMEGNRI